MGFMIQAPGVLGTHVASVNESYASLKFSARDEGVGQDHPEPEGHEAVATADRRRARQRHRNRQAEVPA
jgi:hypothetical protein